MLSTYPYPERTVEKFFCGPETTIYGSGPSSEYTGCPNVVDALGYMNISTIASLVLLQELYTVVANDVSKLSMINASMEVYLSFFSLL